MTESSNSPSVGHAASNNGALSPGLLVNGSAVRAYELKFLLTESLSQDVERWANAHLARDPHGQAALNGAYRVYSLYLDTSRLDVFHRIPPYHRRKLRIRGYGGTASLFLEQKTRRGDRVRKRRTPVDQAGLLRLTSELAECSSAPAAEIDESQCPMAWFRRRVLQKTLQPTFQVSCIRSAFLGHSAEGPVRLTIDRQLIGQPNSGWNLHDDSHIDAAISNGHVPFLADRCVLELKYCNAMPVLFKGLLQDLALTPGPVSKYRLGMAARNGSAH